MFEAWKYALKWENLAQAKVQIEAEKMAKRARDLVEFGPNFAKLLVGGGAWYHRGNQRLFEVAFGAR
jgi:hypothetical protein